MEILIRLIELVILLFIAAFIVVTPRVLLKNRLTKAKLVGIYALMAIGFYILGLIETKSGIVDWTCRQPSFFVGFITIFSSVMSVCVIIYLIFEPIISKININFVVISIALIIIIVGFVLPLIPGILFAFGVKTDNWPIQALDVEPEIVQIEKVSLYGLEGHLYLQVQNNNPFQAIITSVDFDVYSPDGTLIAKGKIPKSIVIPAKQTKLVILKFRIPWTGAGKFAYETLTSILRGENHLVVVRGYAYFDFFGILKIPIYFSKEVAVWS